jgi:hypothetical protein
MRGITATRTSQGHFSVLAAGTATAAFSTARLRQFGEFIERDDDCPRQV